MAVPTDSREATCVTSLPGRTTTSTPRKPTAMATQRRAPTRSPSSGTARSATMHGAVKLMVAAVARPMWRSATKLKAVEPRRRSDRVSWKAGWWVAKSRRPCRGPKAATTKARWPAVRAQSSSITGRSPVRALAATFRRENMAAAPHMYARAMSGRWARSPGDVTRSWRRSGMRLCGSTDRPAQRARHRRCRIQHGPIIEAPVDSDTVATDGPHRDRSRIDTPCGGC